MGIWRTHRVRSRLPLQSWPWGPRKSTDDENRQISSVGPPLISRKPARLSSLFASLSVGSGEKKAESTKEEKDWHVEERSYGSFYRSMSLPFEPEDGAVDAHFDKGVLHLTIKKPAKAIKVTKTIDIKTGATTGTAPRKAA
jgi:Hsp20/alpha crystallin family